MGSKLMDLAIIVTKDMSARKCKCVEKYKVIRAKSTEDLLRSVLLFWMVGPLSCRSFHKRDQEIFRTFLSSINIEHCPKYIKKTGTDHC